MTQTPLTPSQSLEPVSSHPAERILRPALVVDPEALEGRLIAEAPQAKRIRHSGRFSGLNQAGAESELESLSGEDSPCESPTSH